MSSDLVTKPWEVGSFLFPKDIIVAEFVPSLVLINIKIESCKYFPLDETNSTSFVINLH